jgi:hypothetical protein
LVAALSLIALLLGASSAAAQCGQEYHSTPAQSNVPGGAPLAVGDSVLADAAALLARDGFEADGMVCRQMSQGLAVLRERGARLPHLVVLALGTNGEVTPGDINEALRILGPQRILVLVTPHGSVVPSTPQVIREAAASQRERIVLLDWDRLAAGHPEWLAPDGVHLGGQAGIEAFAQMIASVLPYASANPPPSASPPEASPPSTIGAPVTIQPAAPHRPAATHPNRAAPGPKHGAPSPSAPPSAGPGAPTIAPALHPARAATSHGSGSDTAVVLGVLGGVLIGALAVWRLKFH